MSKIYFILICFLFSCPVCAVTQSQLSADRHLILGLSAGPAWISGNQKQTINLQPDIVKTYTADNQSSSFPSAELFIGWQRAWYAALLHQMVVGQFGISAAGAGNAELSGDIWEDADPAFNNFNYTYKVDHAHLALMGRLLVNYHCLFEPFLSASVGMGFNHAYDFSSSPNISEEVAAPPFQSSTTTSFTYTLGIGLQKSLTEQLQAAIAYEFADWGHIELSRAVNQTTGHGLRLNHLYANQLQFSLFYSI